METCSVQCRRRNSNNQRDVVKNERRQSYDNQPYGTASEKIEDIMYPAEHPYHWDTIVRWKI